MLAAFDLDCALMPEVFESIEITGSISASGAEATGLKIGTPVVAGAGDNAAGAVGMGIVSPGMASATIGTSGVPSRNSQGSTLRAEYIRCVTLSPNGGTIQA